MARNKKNNSAAVKFGPALKAFLLCLFIGGSGIGYVWQKNQIQSLGEQIRKSEVQHAQLRRKNKMKSDQLAAMCSPKALEKRIRRLNLGLVQPPVSQIVRLVEIPFEMSRGTPEKQYAETRSPHAIP